MEHLSSDVWGTFRAVRDRWHPKKLDILTGFLGAGAINLVLEFNVTPRIVFGLAANRLEVPQGLIEELKRLQSVGEIRTSPGLHAKLYLFDDKVLIAGSANLTRPGFERLLEVVLVTDKPNTVRAARRIFDATWIQSKKLVVENLRPIQNDGSGFREGTALGSAKSGKSPFSEVLPNKKKLKRAAEKTAPVVRLCSYYYAHIDELRAKNITWSTSENAKAGDIQLFCFVKGSKDSQGKFKDAAHSLWRATGKSKLYPKRARWKVQGPFVVEVRLKHPVPKADFVKAGLLNKYGRWPQGYRGKMIRDREKLAKVLVRRNPEQLKSILDALRMR